jgi:TfoX/Sxy family transcriptional regulator of competence genes
VAFDEDLANRIRELIGDQDGLTERKMFGGVAFMIGGHMSVAASREGGLLLRIPPDQTDALLKKPHARPFVMRGREMDGWVRIDAKGVATRAQLERWVERGVAHARSLPPKSASTPR